MSDDYPAIRSLYHHQNPTWLNIEMDLKKRVTLGTVLVDPIYFLHVGLVDPNGSSCYDFFFFFFINP